jgi:hypothetical protein
MFAFLISLKRLTCPALLVFLDLVTLIFGERHKLLISSFGLFMWFSSVLGIVSDYLNGLLKLQLRAINLQVSFYVPS